MVSFAKPTAPRQSNGGRAGKTGDSANNTAKPNKKQLLALAEKEGRDNTKILQKALGGAGQQASSSTAGRYNQLQQLANRFGSDSSENNQQAPWHHSQQPVPRHMQSSLPEMLAGPPAAYMTPSQQLSVAPFQSQEPVSAYPTTYHQQRSSPQQEAAGGNFMQRNSQRLGGQGVASLLTDASTAAQQPGAGKAAGYMSALADLKPGLTVDQKQKAALQREQLKRDLELQMQAKKEAEAKRKQQLAEQEAREEAALRAYYARQDAQAAAEQCGTAPPNGSTGGGAAHSVQSTGSTAVTATAAPGGHGRAHNDGGSQARGGVVPPTRRTGGAAVEPPQTVHCSQEEPQPAQYASFAASAPYGAAPPMHMAAPAQLASIYSPYLHQLALAQQVPGLSPYGIPSIVPSLPMREPTAASSQLTGLLKELQAEQQHLATQFAAQSETMAKLQSDILSARRERDAAKQQLERVQQMLATDTAAAVQGALSRSACCTPGIDLDALAITTVLPASAGLIPAHVPLPAGSQAQAQHAGGGGPVGRQRPAIAMPPASKQQQRAAGNISASRKGSQGPTPATRSKAVKSGSRGWS